MIDDCRSHLESIELKFQSCPNDHHSHFADGIDGIIVCLFGQFVRLRISFYILFSFCFYLHNVNLLLNSMDDYVVYVFVWSEE